MNVISILLSKTNLPPPPPTRNFQKTFNLPLNFFVSRNSVFRGVGSAPALGLDFIEKLPPYLPTEKDEIIFNIHAENVTKVVNIISETK